MYVQNDFLIPGPQFFDLYKQGRDGAETLLETKLSATSWCEVNGVYVCVC